MKTLQSRKSQPRIPKTKVQSVAALKKKLARRKKGQRVVFTNGCFDLLHSGHVAYLNEARKQGDLLVVALNSDDSVKRLKGPARPLNTLPDRAVVMAGLECVDHVTWFEDDTPLKAILALKPDVLVKGGDWKVDQIVGGREVQGWGGKVKSLNFVEGKSTTGIIAKARAKARKRQPSDG